MRGGEPVKPGLHRQILSNLPDGITIQDRDFDIIYQNEAMRRAFGAHIGEKCYAIYERRDQVCEGCGVRKAFQTGEPNMVLRTAFEVDGTTSYWENVCFPLFDSEGNIIAGVEVCRNTTDRVSLSEEVKNRNIELGQLNRQLNQKTNRLQSALDEREAAERQLRKEIEKREEAETQLREAQKKLAEAAHRAGMADVATDVLHSVGNVLNSIDVSTAHMVDLVIHSKTASLARVTALICEHRDDLGRFLTEDDRGKQIPVLLEEVSRRLDEERSQFAEMLDGLAQNVRHIKDTIAMQQSEAQVSGMGEYVSTVEVIKDAVQINKAGLECHEDGGDPERAQ
jgi:hypothetical protein